MQNRRDFFKIWGAGAVSLMALSDINYALDNENITVETQRKFKGFTKKKISADVLVAGGGMSGVCAAISAARNGASVILVQNRSRLGGNASSEIRMHVVGANSPEKTREWRETGLVEEFKLTDSATNLQRSFEVWDLMLYDKIVSEKNITLLLDTDVYDVDVKNSAINKVYALSSLLEEYYEIEAQYYIDCTGDATVAAVAGADYMRGREGKNLFNESLAPDKSDLKTMGNSILFFGKEFNQPMPYIKPEWARTFTTKDFVNRPINSWEYGYWWLEWGGELDALKDNRKIRHELLRILFGVWDYIKNSGDHPESANWALDWVGMIPGKRESRRVIGDHILIQSEVERSEMFPDRVCYGGWPMDDHPPQGIDGKDLKPCQQIYLDNPYSIPLRCLYSRNIKNLMMAGRNVSASHVAFSSTRVMATCSTMGQAVGTTAAFCIQHKTTPRKVVNSPEQMKSLQQILLKDDQALLYIQNKDKNDLARQATVAASHETPDGKAVQVIDGWNRNIPDGKTHQWQADMQDAEPWIELKWEKPQKISEVQITFDSGLNRMLFITGNERVHQQQIRGAQAECVAGYSIHVKTATGYQEMARCENNFVRLVRHKFDEINTNAIRIVVHKTHGDKLARIYEIRCYS